MIGFVPEMLQNIVGKGENAEFYPFPAIFSKRFFVRVVKSRDCVVKAIDGTSHEIYRAQVEP